MSSLELYNTTTIDQPLPNTSVSDVLMQPKIITGVYADNNPIDPGVVKIVQWYQLGETTLTATNGRITVSNFSLRKDLLVSVFLVAAPSTDDVSVQFNGDTAGNYTFDTFTNMAGRTLSTGQTSFTLNPTATKPQAIVTHFDIFIKNLATSQKVAVWSGTDITGSPPTDVTRFDGNVAWNDTVNQVKTIDVFESAAGVFGIGSRVTVYGKQD